MVIVWNNFLEAHSIRLILDDVSAIKEFVVRSLTYTNPINVRSLTYILNNTYYSKIADLLHDNDCEIADSHSLWFCEIADSRLRYG